jgi:hypothetical protein
MKKSWKTTLGGILAAAGQVAAMSLPPHLVWIGHALTGIGTLLIGAAARDNTVTSRQAGAE